MSEKETRTKLAKMYLTESKYDEIVEVAEKEGMSFSTFCAQAIDLQLHKAKKTAPPETVIIALEPVDIYTEDVTEALSTIGATANKIDRLIFTLSQKSNVSEMELKKLVELTTALKDSEAQFNENMKTVYEDRVKLRNDILKRVDKKLASATGKKSSSGRKEWCLSR